MQDDPEQNKLLQLLLNHSTLLWQHLEEKAAKANEEAGAEEQQHLEMHPDHWTRLIR